MKTAKLVLIWLLFGFVVLYPAGLLIATCFGYTFELLSINVYAVIISLLSILTTVVVNKLLENKIICILLAVITPISLINAGLCIFESSQISVVICFLISFGCFVYLTVKHGKPLALKIIALVLSGLMVLPLCFFSFIALIFGNFGLNTVVKTVESPDGNYYAQVIDSDQGALGGDTFVDVYKGGFDVIFFKIEKKPQRVYSGEWGEYKYLKISWKDDHNLMIGSVEYEIK